MSISKDIDNAIRKWNERSNFTLKGVKNLSRSDLDTLLLYAEYIEKHGTYEGYLMKPRGAVAEVLEKYGLI